ncbi:MAG: 50S ribosomal protein L21 [bacterium]|nr:50S ribosomal protein L21 [bacterium]
MYAVIETGGKQYKISPGDVIAVEKLEGEKGSQVEFDQVHLIADQEQISCGQKVQGARVRGTILGEKKGKKVIAFKYKRRKSYKRKIGHRQKYTTVRVDEILPASV